MHSRFGDNSCRCIIEICSLATCSDSIVDISMVTCAHTISQMICSGGISNRKGKITEITRISTNFNDCKYRSHSASTVLIQQVPFSGLYLMSRYLLFKFALPFSLARTYKRLVQPYRGFLRLCRYSKTFLRTFSTPMHTQSMPRSRHAA